MSDESKPRRTLLNREALLGRALKLLTRRDYSQAELIGRLAERAESAEDIDWVVSRVREAGYLDDMRLAERKVREAREEKLVGRRRAQEELRQRQLDESAIEQVVVPVYADANESELALRFLRERMSELLKDERLEDPKQLQRAYRRLRRSGFGHGNAVRALQQHSRLAAQLDEMEEPGEG